MERHELRGQLEIAVAFGDSLERLVDTDFRIRLFYDHASELTRFGGELSDLEAVDRLHELFTKEENDHLSDARKEACEAACRRALYRLGPSNGRQLGRTDVPQIIYSDDERAEIEHLS